MRYRTSLLLCAGIFFTLSVAMLGPATAGWASGQDKDPTIDTGPTDVLCRSMNSTQSGVRPSLVSYWLLGRANLGPNTWLENWRKQSGLRRESVALPTAPDACTGLTARPNRGGCGMSVAEPMTGTGSPGGLLSWPSCLRTRLSTKSDASVPQAGQTNWTGLLAIAGVISNSYFEPQEHCTFIKNSDRVRAGLARRTALSAPPISGRPSDGVARRPFLLLI